ncbi:homoserine kinase [Ferrimicrobium sp.]|uniref:homoserine kinase n=1 Tax=Ferrimicrobium sp. TaxID=2926050 RepID=UPI0026154B14|nr:homoserine kinase [Ferrimicrobium sp.]
MGFKSVRVPGSSANLGPGFDTLALAVPLYLTATAYPSDSFVVELRGEGASEVVTGNHLIHQLVVEVLGHDRVGLVIDSEIPLARGLGSSAALVLGVAGALGHPDPLGVALDFESHPENVAASYWGGGVAALVAPSGPVIRRISVDPLLRLVVIIPPDRLATEAARRLLPQTVTFDDAVFNLSHAVVLAASLGHVEELVPALFEDHLHQDARAVAFPESRRLLAMLLEAGCLGASWSGAGTICVGFTDLDRVDAIHQQVQAAMRGSGLNYEVRSLAVDLEGLTTLTDAGEKP